MSTQEIIDYIRREAFYDELEKVAAHGLKISPSKVVKTMAKTFFPNAYEAHKTVSPRYQKLLKQLVSPPKVRKSGYVEPKKIKLHHVVKEAINDPHVGIAFSDIAENLYNILSGLPGVPPLPYLPPPQKKI